MQACWPGSARGPVNPDTTTCGHTKFPAAMSRQNAPGGTAGAAVGVQGNFSEHSCGVLSPFRRAWTCCGCGSNTGFKKILIINQRIRGLVALCAAKLESWSTPHPSLQSAKNPAPFQEAVSPSTTRIASVGRLCAVSWRGASESRPPFAAELTESGIKPDRLRFFTADVGALLPVTRPPRPPGSRCGRSG